MSQDVTQWLAEIRTLQRQLADVRQERDQAYASAANWRRLYETEARQRRTEVADFQTQLKALKANNPIHRSTDPIDQSPSNHPAYASPNLQAQLEAAQQTCKDLAQKLATEKAAHNQTRHILTTALGDTFDTLKPARESALTNPPAPSVAQNQDDR